MKKGIYYMYLENQFIKDLEKLISINSVEGKSEQGKPFGEKPFMALECFLSIARKMGFYTKNYDGYMGEITFGDGEELGIIGHLDVVPEGTGWNTEPYTLTKKDGVYYGRGILDDKAPLLICLYILKEMKDSGVIPNRKFRLFVGANEETGWKDVEYFSKNYGFPEYGFSPDGNFPVSYAEKGMAIVKFTLPKLNGFHKVSGGTVVNAVCGKAFAVDKASGNELVFNGKSCHGSCPQNGVNAIKLMYEYFNEQGENVKDILDNFFYDKQGVFGMENEQGKITFSPDLISEDENAIYLTCDCRYPYPFTDSDVKEKFDKFGYPYEFKIKHPTAFVDKDSFLVSTLINAYNDITGKNEKPVSQCGTTFARVFKKGVAFGPEFPEKPSTIHQPNECASEEELELIYQIYKKAMFDLAK